MDLLESFEILNKNGFLLERNTDYMEGEKGGEKYYDLPNDYSYNEALKIFVSAIFKYTDFDSDELVQEYVEKHVTKYDMNKFTKNYNQFESYKKGEPIKIYRGIVLKGDEKLDLDDIGECWTFNRNVAKEWVIGYYKSKKYEAFMNHTKFEDYHLYVVSGTTELDNCRLPYSLWLAGKFDRNECEVRVKDPKKVKIKKYVEVFY